MLRKHCSTGIPRGPRSRHSFTSSAPTVEGNIKVMGGPRKHAPVFLVLDVYLGWDLQNLGTGKPQYRTGFLPLPTSAGTREAG